MKHLNKLSVKIVIALAIGVFFAMSLTDIAYLNAPPDASCRLVYKDGVSSIVYEDAAGNPLPGDPTACRGVTYESVISHPRDLLNNEQDSLERSFETFAVVSLVSFAILHIYTILRKKNRNSKS